MALFLASLAALVVIILGCWWIAEPPPREIPKPRTRATARALRPVLTPQAIAQHAPGAKHWRDALVITGQAAHGFKQDVAILFDFLAEADIHTIEQRAQSLADRDSRAFPSGDIPADAAFVLFAIGEDTLPPQPAPPSP